MLLTVVLCRKINGWTHQCYKYTLSICQILCVESPELGTLTYRYRIFAFQIEVCGPITHAATRLLIMIITDIFITLKIQTSEFLKLAFDWESSIPSILLNLNNFSFINTHKSKHNHTVSCITRCLQLVVLWAEPTCIRPQPCLWGNWLGKVGIKYGRSH